jgi:hypothetical protein
MDRCFLSSFAGRKTSMERSDRAAAEVRQRSVPVYWIIGLLVFANTMICYFDRVNFSVAAPTIMKLFHWDMGILGLAMSMFGVGYILTQIPAGLLGDRFGGRWDDTCFPRSAFPVNSVELTPEPFLLLRPWALITRDHAKKIDLTPTFCPLQC